MCNVSTYQGLLSYNDAVLCVEDAINDQRSSCFECYVTVGLYFCVSSFSCGFTLPVFNLCVCVMLDEKEFFEDIIFCYFCGKCTSSNLDKCKGNAHARACA